MRHSGSVRGVLAIAALCGVTVVANAASAQVAAQGSVQIGAPVAVGDPNVPPPQPQYVQAQPQYVTTPQPMYVANFRPTAYTGGPIPAGMHVEQRPMTGLAVAGGTLFISTYGLNLIFGLSIGVVPYSQSALFLTIPVVGPIILGGSACGASGYYGACASLMVLSVFDTLAQAAGIAMFAAGMAATRPMLVWNAAGAVARPSPRDRPIQWALGPSMTAGAPGMSLSFLHF